MPASPLRALCLAALPLLSCNGKETGDSSPPTQDDSFALTGLVQGTDLAPLAGVEIIAGEHSATTDELGTFTMEGLPQSVELCASLEGWATSWRHVDFTATHSTVRIGMLPMSRSTMAEGTREISEEGGLSVIFEGEFLDADGAAVSGEIDVDWDLFDARPEAWALPPTVIDGGEPFLGLAALVLELSQDGEPISFEGSATVTLPPAPLAPIDDAEELAVFSYQPDLGTWSLEGEAALTDDGLLSFEADHFSWWMVGTRGEPGCLEGELFGASGEEPDGAIIEAITTGGASLVQGRYPGELGLRQGRWGSHGMSTPPMSEDLGLEVRALWREPSTGELQSWSWPGSERGETELSPDGCVLCGTGTLGGLRQDADGDGYSLLQGDCDDADASISPAASDTVGDGIDDNCDGIDGEDADGDGWASVDSGGEDCEDSVSWVNPDSRLDSGVDGIDQDCDGLDGPDRDGDGFADSERGGDDCDDTDASVYPGATEACDGVDADCDGRDEYLIPGDFSAIGDAMMPRVEGAQVCVSAGTYAENVDFGGLAIEIVGVDGPDLTTIQGDCTGSVVTMENGEGPDTVLEGFTISGGCVSSGAGMYLEGVSPTLRDLVVSDNFSDGSGGGIYAGDSSPTVSEVRIRSNEAHSGGGLCLRDDSGTWSGIEVSNNLAEYLGGGVSAYDLTGTYEDWTVQANQAYYGGGLYLATHFTSSGSFEVLDNVAERHGGGLYTGGSAWLQLDGAVISGNQADSYGGGAYFTESFGGLVGASFEDNYANFYGGGLALFDGEGSFARLSFSGNQAGSYGGGLYVGYWPVEPVTVVPSLQDMEFEGNSAHFGGGAAVDTHATLEQVSFTGNEASSGGGLWLGEGFWTGIEVTLSQAVITENEGSSGGGIYLDECNLDADWVLVAGNTGARGAGILVSNYSTIEARHLILAGNQSRGYGGGLTLYGDASLSFADVVGNSATYWGGGVEMSSGADLLLSHVILSSNEASEGGGLYSWDENDELIIGYCDLWGNLPEDSVGLDDATSEIFANYSEDPEFVDTSSEDPLAWDLHLGPDSPMIDAGEYQFVTDPDGSRVDVGAYGGENADGWDLDGDGYPGWWHPGPYDFQVDPADGWDEHDLDPDLHPAADDDGDGYTPIDGDCDDTSAEAHPGGTEVCDGLDNDCDAVLDDDEADLDGDGWLACVDDCDDADSSSHPGADELCDGVDNDCDGSVPSDETDADGDGWLSCEDCDDSDAAIFPGADELCNGVDDDCDGDTDEDDATDAPTWYSDFDADGFGDSGSPVSACTQPSGTVAVGGDCDDGDAVINPDASEACNGIDDDCDGTVPSDETDADGDGWMACEECGDSDAAIFPGATELCNGIDDDCDGTVPSDEADADGDGWMACEECDDSDATNNPSASELCDGVDNDCDGDIDEDDATDATYWWFDSDGDGVGDAALRVTACNPPSGYVSDSGDCDDTNAAVHPYADEICDGLDNDCNGLFDDEAIDAGTWYQDLDGDGWGDSASSTTACTQPTGTVAVDGDCDDSDAGSNPGASELCDGADNDCDGVTDEDDALDASAWYQDSDGDGWGDGSVSTTACTQPSGYAALDGDCDHSDAAVSPDAAEQCDSIDNDCDGVTDEADAIDAGTWFQDSDADGYGDITVSTTACTQPSGYVASATDCDDSEPLANPGETEICGDGIDNDCDGTATGCTLYGDLDLSLADAALYGEAAYDYAANTIAGLGDIDGDGYGDVLVGAYANDSAAADAGAAYLFMGPVTGSHSLADADATMLGGDANDRLGWGVGPAGDVDGDGLADMMIGAPTADGLDLSTGYIALVYGSTSVSATLTPDVMIYGAAYSDWLGKTMTSAGDVNGDGYADLLLGAQDADPVVALDGQCYLFLGPLTTDVSASAADLIMDGEGWADKAGVDVAGAGDVDGDGLDDLLIGATGDDDAYADSGAAYLVLGTSRGSMSLAGADAKITGVASNDGVGRAVDGAGDVNGDGYGDILLGAYGYDSFASDAGAAFVVLGPVTGSSTVATAWATLEGEATDDAAGTSVAGDLDTDLDGEPDLLIGGIYVDGDSLYEGAAYLVRGPITAGTMNLADADLRVHGEGAADRVGEDVASAGDVNGDGAEDLFVGSSDVSDSSLSQGAAYIIFGGGL